MSSCLSVSFRTIKEKKNKFVSYYLFIMCKFQLITTNKNMKQMINSPQRRGSDCTDAQSDACFYTASTPCRTTICLPGKRHLCQADSGPLKKFAHKDSDQTAQSDARFYPASTRCRMPAKRHLNVVSLAGG